MFSVKLYRLTHTLCHLATPCPVHLYSDVAEARFFFFFAFAVPGLCLHSGRFLPVIYVLHLVSHGFSCGLSCSDALRLSVCVITAFAMAVNTPFP